MKTRFALKIAAQPTETSCGPTCLHAVYRHYGDDITLAEVIAQTRALREGGTLDAFLAQHALRRGYQATIYCFNLDLFDPTWFALKRDGIRKKLLQQRKIKTGPKLKVTTDAYVEFLRLGGKLKLKDLTPALLRRFLKRGTPILAGLSSTWLYRAPREIMQTTTEDDVRGTPAGHFVVLHGYDQKKREVWIADPYARNPYTKQRQYMVKIERLIAAVLLGVVTYDCNLLVIEPRRKKSG